MAGTAPARPRPCRGYPAVRLAAPPAARMRYVGHGSDVPASVPGASRRSVGHRPRPRPGGTRYTPAPRTARAPEGRATRPRPGGTRSQVRRPPAARRRYVGHGSGVPASVPGAPRRSVGRTARCAQALCGARLRRARVRAGYTPPFGWPPPAPAPRRAALRRLAPRRGAHPGRTGCIPPFGWPPPAPAPRRGALRRVSRPGGAPSQVRHLRLCPGVRAGYTPPFG